MSSAATTTAFRRAATIFLAGWLVLCAVPASAEYGLNMTKGVTAISGEVYRLHMLIFWICVAIGVVVFGTMIYSIIKHRKSRGVEAAQFHHSTTVEIVWTVIPFLILVIMAVPATVALIEIEDTSEHDMSIQITGYQWKWKYDYLDEGIGFFSNLAPSSREVIEGDPRSVENYLLEVDEPLVVPVDTRIRFLITANDVIHAWWVPDLGWKQDAIPGFVNDAWTEISEPGIYRGQCAELCGKDHGFMPIEVHAVSQADYRAWVTERQEAAAALLASADREWSQNELMERGKKIYDTTCIACHQANGQGMPPVFPAIAGSPVATGPIDQHMELVLNGVPGSAMQAFGPQLSDVDVAAVMTYQRNAFGNDTGDLIQPSDVKDAR